MASLCSRKGCLTTAKPSALSHAIAATAMIVTKTQSCHHADTTRADVSPRTQAFTCLPKPSRHRCGDLITPAKSSKSALGLSCFCVRDTPDDYSVEPEGSAPALVYWRNGKTTSNLLIRGIVILTYQP